LKTNHLATLHVTQTNHVKHHSCQGLAIVGPSARPHNPRAISQTKSNRNFLQFYIFYNCKVLFINNFTIFKLRSTTVQMSALVFYFIFEDIFSPSAFASSE
jgi:hypothetical protein